MIHCLPLLHVSRLDPKVESFDSAVDGGAGVGANSVEASVAEQVGDVDGPITRIWLLPLVSTSTGWGRTLVGHRIGAGVRSVCVWGGLAWQDHDVPGLGDVGLGEVAALACEPVPESLPGLFCDRDWWWPQPPPAEPRAEPLAAMPPPLLVLGGVSP
jgi:hypothetical protein